jgi:hypothetical protein
MRDWFDTRIWMCSISGVQAPYNWQETVGRLTEIIAALSKIYGC